MVQGRDGAEGLLSPELAASLRDALGLAAAPQSLAEVFTGPVECWVETLFSPVPTGHRVRVGGRSGHLKCALDGFLLAFLQDEPVELRSTSPLTGTEVRAEISRDGFRLSHAGAVLSLAAVAAGAGSCLCVRCPDVHLFPSQEEYGRWAAAAAGAGTVPLPAAAAFELVRMVVREASPDGDPGKEACS